MSMKIHQIESVVQSSSSEIQQLLLQTVTKIRKAIAKWNNSNAMYPGFESSWNIDNDFGERTMLLVLNKIGLIDKLYEEITHEDYIQFSVNQKALGEVENILKKTSTKEKFKNASSIYEYESYISLIDYDNMPDWRQKNINTDMLYILNQLWQVCEQEEQPIELVWPSSMVRTNSLQVGFLFLQNLKFLEGNNVLSKIVTKEISATKRIYTAIISRDKLFHYISDFHDLYETKHGQLLRFPQQKKNLLVIIKRKVEQEGTEEITISEQDFGEFEFADEGHPYYEELFLMDYGNPVGSYEFMKVLNSLREDGLIDIVDADFSLDAYSQPTDEKISPHKYLPAQHCKITVRFNESNRTFTKIRNSKKDEVKWPKEFKWNKYDKSEYELGNSKHLHFDKKSGNLRKQIFEMLAMAEGEFVNVSDIAKSVERENGYVRSVIGQLNKQIRIQGCLDRLKIDSREEQDAPGAYRIIPIQKVKQ